MQQSTILHRSRTCASAAASTASRDGYRSCFTSLGISYGVQGHGYDVVNADLNGCVPPLGLVGRDGVQCLGEGLQGERRRGYLEGGMRSRGGGRFLGRSTDGQDGPRDRLGSYDGAGKPRRDGDVVWAVCVELGIQLI